MASGLQKLVALCRICTKSRYPGSLAPVITAGCSNPPHVNRGVHSCTHIPARAQYGGRHTVAMLPGDGVGPELMHHVRDVYRHVCAPVDFEEVQLDHAVTDEQYDHAVLAVKRNGIALKGNVGRILDDRIAKPRNFEFLTELDLFANVVWCKSIPGLSTRHKDIDVIIVRENTEGEYSQLEHQAVGDMVESLKIVTEHKSTRIAKYAFDFAVQHNRKKVTAVHKANIMKLGDGLFLECCRKVSEQYPHIEFEAMIIDNCCMQMVSQPQQFDVMVLPNLYGNIIANIGVGLVGGTGVVSGINMGEQHAVFETATRNVGLSIARQNIANPAAILLASSDLLAHLGLHSQADVIKAAVYKTLNEDQIHTPDVGGQATTQDVMQAVIGHIQEAAQ